MVRSKFPGKPSKIVNRKVVKSSKYCVLQDNESSKAAENISYGLAVFNETFGDHEQVLTAFHGFSPHEVDKARDEAIKQQDKVEEEYRTNGLNFPPDDAFPVKIDPPTSQVLSYVAANLSLIGPVGGHSTRAQCQNLHLEMKGVDLSKSISPSKFFSPVKTNFKKHVANRLLQRAKKSSLDVPSSNKELKNTQFDSSDSLSASGGNRTFVLPCRSSRSSRVIKPNKRFLDSDGGEDTPAPTNVAMQPSQTRVIELKKPRLIFDGEVDFSVSRSDSSKVNPSDGKFTSEMPAATDCKRTEHVKLADLNVFGASTTRPRRRMSQSSLEGSPKKDEPVVVCTSPKAKQNQLRDAESPSRSKLILRESKLNISSATDKVKGDLFSSKPKKGLGVKVIKSPGTSIECGICGAIRFHRLTKASLKFGLICCDPCCRFVAKMMLRAKSSENSVPCEIGQGNCAVSSPLKGESFATKVNRCGACWLLLCVQRLIKMPEKIRDGLIRMLPANMQGMTVLLPPVAVVSTVTTSRNRRRKGQSIQDEPEVSSSSASIKLSPKSSGAQSTPSPARKLSTSSTNKRMAQTPIARIKRKAALVSLANNLKRVRDKTYSPVTASGSFRKSSPGETLEKPSKLKKLSPSKKAETWLKNAEKCVKKGNIKTLGKMKDGQVRQKLSLKGPRVKHVCRSASIVLGQPLATFPMKSPVSPSDDITNEASTSFSLSNPLEEVQRSKPDKHIRETRSKVESKAPSAIEVEDSKVLGTKCASTPHFALPTSVTAETNFKCISKNVAEPRGNHNPPAGRKVTRLPHNSNQSKMLQRGQRRTLQDLGVYSNQNVVLPELISLDFWESYDPDEVCNTGFGLIGFDPFNMKPVCFLCGSAGSKKLIHCASCCEPYHQFCIEMGVLGGPGPLPSKDQSNKEIWRVDWVCPRCTVCHGCGYNTGHQLTICQRCHHSYHLECLGTTALRKNASDRLWICSSCLRCKSCNSADVTKFVGNLPFCKVCFKLRQKGNFCPLCHGCYTDDDYQSKMMECADCKSWVHAKCEGLSDEKYQVLSYLPESVEFICRLCCAVPPAPWWVAVEAELQVGYNNIIKAITKNRKAYAMLKWSPQKTCVCQPRLTAPTSRIANPVLAVGKRRLSFNVQNQEEVEKTCIVLQKPLCLSQPCKGSVTFKEDQVSSVFEFDEDIDAGENSPITKYTHAKEKNKGDCIHQEYSKLHLDCGTEAVVKQEKSAQFSPNAGSQSDSGVGSTDDELKAFSAAEEEEVEEFKTEIGEECMCTCQNLKPAFPTLLSIKRKAHSNEYSSILEFHRDMDLLISEADSHEVKELYHQTLQEVFPWFDPKYDKVSRNSFPLSPCKPHHGSRLQFQSNGASPEKFHSDYSSSLKILERLLPKDASKLDDDYYYCGMNPPDSRLCGFCKSTGDSEAYAEGRLLYCGQNEWVHVNCALWSAEVFEEIDGALQNVSNALSRGRMIRCSQCNQKGASVGCCAKKCEETLHFPCARMAGFVFMEDKNVFCSLHAKDAPGKPLTKAVDFDVCRPVFVEIDRRKKKSVESKHVRLMIGSLLVQNLGTIVADISDLGSSIVPTQFSCTRLFWSSKEPWRIVRYTIQTTIRFPTPEPVEDLGHHITVDHSKETTSIISKIDWPMPKPGEGLERCLENQGNLDNGRQVEETASGENKCKTDVKVVEAVVSQLLDSVCSREADEEVTDVQNSADLLPPELKDAIFEDLPHDLLDGISMQDIFQDKFLNFEELNKEESHEESSANGPAKCESEKHKIRNLRAPRELKRSKSDVLPSNSSQADSRLHQRSCSLAWSYKLGTNISCCKTQNLSTTEVVVDRTKLIQELRLSVKPAPSDLRYCLPGPGDKGKENQSLSWSRIMQVDGICDAVLSGSDEGSDVDTEDVRRNQVQLNINLKSCKTLPSSFIKDSELLRNRIECLKTVTSAALSQNAAQTCESWCQDPLKSKRRRFSKKMVERKVTTVLSKNLIIPQLDGTNDVSSDSEQEGIPSKHINEQCDEKPVRCSRCGCTYRTEESHARHLPSCSGDYSLTTSESEAEISEEEVAGTAQSVFAPSPDSAISVSSGCISMVASSATALPVLPTTPPAVLPIASTTILSTAPPAIVPTVSPAVLSTIPSTIVPSAPQVVLPSAVPAVLPSRLPAVLPSALPTVSPIALPAMTAMTTQPNSSAVLPVTLNSSRSTVGNQAVVTSLVPSIQPLQNTSNSIQGAVTASFSKVQRISSNKSKATRTSSQQQTMKFVVKDNQSVLQQVFEQRSHQQISQPALQQSLPTSLAHHPMAQQTSQVITMMDYQQPQHGPTVLVQSVPSQAMVPAYLEAFQQHTGQNLQYLATVDSNTGYGKTQYLTAVPSTVVPGAFQLQAMPDGQLCLEPRSVGIPTISGIQLAQAQLPQAQPQVLGTLLPSPLSCGVVATTEPVYETIQMFPDQSGGVLLASQPMLTCMETVVSNTFMSMSSSQFVSSSVAGMLQGSSTFSTTTTQVFQASKVDPPVLDVPTQYVVVNAHPSIPDAAVRKLEVMSLSQPQIQEQAPIQSQARIQIPSINLPVPVTVTAPPLPPQTLPPVIPTSVVTPMPRVQPQRTYSKPMKGAKDSLIMKKVVPQIACASAKQTMKNQVNQAAPKCLKDVSASLAKTTPCLGELNKKVISSETLSKTPLLPQTCNPMKNKSTAVLLSQPPSELITTSTAPAQSVTLPDPVKLNPPVINGPMVAPVSVAPVKCPPVTFSYRAHAVENSKPKQSPVLTTVASDIAVVPKSRVQICSEPPHKNLGQDLMKFCTNQQPITSGSAAPASDSVVPSASASSTDEQQNESSSVRKPTAAILPQFQLAGKPEAKKIESMKSSASSCPDPSKAAVSTVMNVMPAVPRSPVKLSTSVAIEPTNSALTTQPSSLPSNTISSDSSLSQVVKNVSLSLTTASITDSITNTATSLTASSNLTVPVTTPKLQNASVTGLQPLKEINPTNLNTDVKPVPQVLKSSSQNVERNKKCEVYCSQSELPLVFPIGDSNPSPLKLLFQKQAHNGCYKVSSSPNKKDGELMAVKLADISIVTSGIKDKKAGKDENMKPTGKISKRNQMGPLAPEIVYEIHCQDGFSYTSSSISDAWQKVFGAVQEARANHQMPPLIHNPFNSSESAHNVMGLGNNSLKYLLEQLPGVGDCTKYRPVYHKSRLPGPGYQYKREEQDLRESRSGCARTDPYMSAKKYDMFSWLDSRHRRPPKLLDNNDIDSLNGSRRAASTSLPMAMRFRHLRETSKTSVGVFRSDIHGRGLFCLRDIEAGEMVIEYAGEVIRNTLTDNREKYYQSKGIGCYMFKVDDNFTVDATQKGNAARFINHSCEPNCYSRVVDILGKKHIIIFAFRRIPQGEELTYDYKFPIEDEKIHCHCLARRCRKYLN